LFYIEEVFLIKKYELLLCYYDDKYINFKDIPAVREAYKQRACEIGIEFIFNVLLLLWKSISQLFFL